MVILTIKEDFDYASKNPKLCALGEYKGRTFIVIYVGTHPCAYVACETDLYKQQDEQENFSSLVHGGFTWYGSLGHWTRYFHNVDPKILAKKYVGWDYAHFGDYSRFYEDGMWEKPDDFTKWTTDDLIDCIVNLIDWMDKNGIN